LIVRVVDAESGTPVDAARVSLRIASEPLNDRGAWSHHEGQSVGRTNFQGVLKIEGLHPHRYLLDVEAPGFVRHVAATRLLPDRPLQARLADADLGWHTLTMGHWNPAWEDAIGDFSEVRRLLPVVPQEGEVRVDVPLKRARMLQGSVRNRAGKPLPEVRISIPKHEVTQTVGAGWKMFGLDPSEPVFTNAAGVFLLSVHPGGCLTVRADIPGHVYDQKDVDLDSPAVPSLDFVLDPCAALQGVVLGEFGSSPVAGATVAAFVPKPGGRIFHTKTDAEGRFRLDDVENESLVVVAWEFFSGACSLVDAPLDQPIALLLESPRKLEGRVVDIDGRPLQQGAVHQRVTLRVRGRTIHLGFGEMMGGGGRVRSGMPGILGVGVPIQEPLALIDAQGRFSLETILDDGGRVHIDVFQSGKHGDHRSMETTEKLGLFREIVFHPGEETGGMYAEANSAELSTPEDHAERASFRMVRQDYAGAIEDYTSALRRSPDDPDLLSARAVCYQALHRHEEAILDLTTALKIRPENPALLHSRGYACYLAGRPAEALTDLSSAIRLEPGHAGHYSMRCNIRLSSGDLSGALSDANESLRLQPEEQSFFLSRGWVREKMGDLEAALQDCEEALRLHPMGEGALSLRGRIRRRKGDLRGALADLEAALERIPDMLPDWRKDIEGQIEEIRRQAGT
jgi:tetratricopeptide (TPR) repeat protein